MRKIMKRTAGAAALVAGFVLSSCGGSTSSGSTNSPKGGVSLTGVVVVDSAGKAVANAGVSITSKTSGVNVAAGALMAGAAAGVEQKTDKDGKITMGDKGSDKQHTVKITCADGTIIVMNLEVDANDKADLNEEMKIQLPISAGSNTCKKIKAKVTSLSGNVHDVSSGAGLAGVTVTLLSQKIGMVASSKTSVNGEYTLVANIEQKKVSELKKLELIFTKDGYNKRSEKIKLKANTIRVGHDIDLAAMTAAEVATAKANIVYSDDFENGNAWSMTGLWHAHSGTTVKNAAVTQGLVGLAPDDKTAGDVPSAMGTTAMWFGKATGSGNVVGNYLEIDDPYSNTLDAMNGGMTYDPSMYSNAPPVAMPQMVNVYGNLTSPVINLSQIASPYVSLTFDSWWEIESVNPNTTGYDRLTIQYTIDSGATWVNLARLNPLADPYTDTVRDAIPYTNNGFNVAPSWLKQENIPLINPVDGTSLAGQAALQIRFNFDTVDPMYNGFRGWLIDNVKVVKSASSLGTFPVMDPYSLFMMNDASSAFYDPYASQALVFEWIFPAWNDVTGDLAVTPSMFDATATSGLTEFVTGKAYTINATFDYEAATGSSAKLMYALDGGAPVAFGNIVALTQGSMKSVTLSGSVTAFTGNATVDISVQMYDTATGSFIMDAPVATYGVK